MELEPIELPTEEPTNEASALSSAPSPPFDLEAYVARYEPTSETRLQRLLLIGSRCSSGGGTAPSTACDTAAVAAQAYRLAERQCRDTANVRTYRQVFGGGQATSMAATAAAAGAGAAGSGSGEATAAGNEESESSAAMMIPPELLEGNLSSPSANSNSNSNATTLLPASLPHNPAKYGLAFDATFATTTDHTSQLHLQALEARLSQAQSRLAKDAIRTAYLALAEHHRLRGDLRESLRKLLRSRDFCTHTRQSGAVCLLVIELGVDMRNFALVKDYVAKAEHTTDLLHTDPLFAAKLRAASGIALLAESRYAEAARKFATVHSDLTTQFATVLSAEDIALYGSLLGMAVLDRSELHDLLLDSSTFKGRLELVPPMREVLRHYALAEYGPALALLSGHVRPQLELDLHLRPHAEPLLRRIRDRCIVQYLAPYSKVSLVTMAEGFRVTPTEMERIVSTLVQRGQIRGGAKIHAPTQTLVAEPPRRYQRRRKGETRAKMVRLGRTFVDEAEGLVLRLSCVENGLVVSEGGRRGGFGGGGGGLWAAGGGAGGAGGRRGRGAGGGRSTRGQHPPSLGGGADADAAAMMMAYGIDDDSSSDDDEVGGHHGGGEYGDDDPLPDMDVGGDEEEMMMDVDDYANPEGGI